MKPYIGISKNLGHGVRVGFALPVMPSSNKSKREEANEKFIRDARARVYNTLSGYIYSHGILATPDTIGALDAETLSKIEPQIESLQQNVQTVADAIRIFQDTGSLQQSTKEKVMRNIYEIERVAMENAGITT